MLEAVSSRSLYNDKAVHLQVHSFFMVRKKAQKKDHLMVDCVTNGRQTKRESTYKIC